MKECPKCGSRNILADRSCKPCGFRPLGPVPGSGDWDVERTHGRLCKVQYDVGCKEADEYCDKLRADGWKAWSVSSDGKRVTEVFYLPYTNTAHERQLPSQNAPDQATARRKP